MADEPRPAPGPDDRPPFFKTVNGWIAGLTGLVLAVAGLFTACDKLFPDDPRPPAASSTTEWRIDEEAGGRRLLH